MDAQEFLDDYYKGYNYSEYTAIHVDEITEIMELYAEHKIKEQKDKDTKD